MEQQTFNNPPEEQNIEEDHIITHDKLFELLSRWTEEKGNTRYYFRGEDDYNYGLQPSLLRKDNFSRLSEKYNTPDPIKLEELLIQRFKRYTAHIYHQTSDFYGRKFQDLEMLCLAQHNGLPTLLVDFTLNPLVALYFALRSHQYQDISEGDDKDAALWVMQLKEKSIRKDLTIHLEDSSDVWEKNFDRFRETRPLLIVPLAFTHRISSQAGRFVYAGYLTTKESARNTNDMYLDKAEPKEQMSEKILTPWSKLTKYKIPKATDENGREERRKLLRTLRFLGIHEGTLLTDLEGWAKYLKDGNL